MTRKSTAIRLNITNEQFLDCVFGKDKKNVHVTDFPYDPMNIPAKRHLGAWCGNSYSKYRFGSQTNQYFTISIFSKDEKHVARRRKALFKSTPCIVLDDVKEKLSMSEVKKLPDPSWILETSPGSEQWGYILDKPCTNRAMVENLLDGLVANGLAPEGKDPGMKGVTRYVRLPEGFNMKKSKYVNGTPHKCGMLLWEPFNATTIEALAEPFNVDLYAIRREGRVDGASEVVDHPLLNVADLIHIKEVRSAGRYDVTCPWVDEHTGGDDSGAAIFTNEDGTMGFKCHHGACEERTGATLLKWIEKQAPGFNMTLKKWQMFRAIGEADAVVPTETAPAPPTSNISPEVNPISDTADNLYEPILARLKGENRLTDNARDMAAKILKLVDTIPPIDRLAVQEEVRIFMCWTKGELKVLLDSLRADWYVKTDDDISFFDEVMFLGEQNQFFDRDKRIFYTPEAYNNAYSHLDADARKEALTGGRVTKVDRLDYAPKKPRVFKEKGITYGNAWTDKYEDKGVPGDVSRWLKHFEVLGWENEREHMLKWMAWTLVNPDKKINHMLLLGSKEGTGKDWLLTPLTKALGDNSMTISGDELLSDFNDYILSVKHLNINEAELGDRKEALMVANRLKPLTTAPPERLRLNQKSIKPVRVRNILSVTMTTNSQTPIKLSGTSRRIFAVWSDLITRDSNDETLPEWHKYWADRWEWMEEGGGAQACIDYLRNCVDISGFNPQQAPPMTRFLREIVEASKSPVQQMIDTYIMDGLGAMKSDLVTSQEISTALKAYSVLAPEFDHIDMRACTPNKITTLLKTMSNTMPFYCRAEGSRVTIWCVRNHERYRDLKPAEIFKMHQSMVSAIQNRKPIKPIRRIK